MSISVENFFKRRVYIDEDGYPMLDGARVQDESSLKEIFSNLKRIKSEDFRSTLITTWGGIEASVEAFSSPFIVQSVTKLSEETFMSHLLGDLSFEFDVSQLQIDEWNRLHLYLGTDQIEATFSRKAQAQLLLALDHEVMFAAFRSNASAVRQHGFWDEAYEAGKDGWDLGTLCPSLERLAVKWLVGDKIPKRVLVPGAGRGYEAQWLAQKGLLVTAEDFSIRARDEFFKIHKDSKVTYKTSDFFSTEASKDDGYDAILELIFFCAIDPQKRQQYFERIYQRLKPGGLLVGIFFVSYGPGGPPYSTTPWELKAHAQKYFHVKHWQMSQHSVPARLGKEFEVVLQKRI